MCNSQHTIILLQSLYVNSNILESLENKMEWLKTFERVKEIEKQLIWPTISEIDTKAFIPEVSSYYVTQVNQLYYISCSIECII